MPYYHFSDIIINPGEVFPTGNFAQTIANSTKVVQEFEELMEKRRVALTNNKPSRLNCLFTFGKEYAEGFKTKRKFLYVLDCVDDTIVSEHNYEIGTYFSGRFQFNDIELIKLDAHLFDDYWNNVKNNKTSDGIPLNYVSEYLLNKAPIIKRVIQWNPISMAEWLQLGKFYHITPSRCLESIYENGIENRNKKGICVVRTNHPNVVEYICEMMLIADGDNHFSIIEIDPITHNLTPEEIVPDAVIELTNIVHNYILRDKIEVSEKNVIGNYQSRPMGIADLKKFEENLKELGILIEVK